MPKSLVTDELWAVVEPLLPKEPPKPKSGRPRIDGRAHGHPVRTQDGHSVGDAALRDGLRLRHDPLAALKVWHEVGVWEQLLVQRLDRLRQDDQIDWSRASLD